MTFEKIEDEELVRALATAMYETILTFCDAQPNMNQQLIVSAVSSLLVKLVEIFGVDKQHFLQLFEDGWRKKDEAKNPTTVKA